MDLVDLADLVAAEAQRRQQPAFSFASLGPRGARKQLALLLCRTPRDGLSEDERAQVQRLCDALQGTPSTTKLTGDTLMATDLLCYHRLNAVLKRALGGKGRGEMNLAELEAALGWLERHRLVDHLQLLEGDARYVPWGAPRGHRRAAAAGHGGTGGAGR
jgi:hypothetical protein